MIKVKEIWIEPGMRDPYDANSAVTVTLEDGSRWWASFVSFANIATLARYHKETGVNLSGKYVWIRAMILVDEVSRASIEQVVQDLLAKDYLDAVFDRLEPEPYMT